MITTEVEHRNIAVIMRKSVENLVTSSQEAIGHSISQALSLSGGVTQHVNQKNSQELKRNVSRSPSPSLRNTEATITDTIENDKQNDVTIQVPTHGAGDAVSLLPLLEPIPISSNTKLSEHMSKPIPIQALSTKSEGSTRSKKKSWYSALYPTYKSRSEDFKRIFKDSLPEEERLIVDYSCALQRDILAHGRLYVSQNYLCFYANIFGWETSMTLRWKDVTAITKEKTALVIPNAILVCTENEKNFLTSFSGRDKAYLMLFRVWQNALMNQPLTTQEIWQWIHNYYGEELGFNSDDEDYNRDVAEDEKAFPSIMNSATSTSLPPLESVGEFFVDSTSSIEQSRGSGGDDTKSEKGADIIPLTTNLQSLQAEFSGPVTNGDVDYHEEMNGRDILPTDMSDSSESDPDKPRNSAEEVRCQVNHDGRLLLQIEVPFDVNQLFTMIFTNSKFNLETLAARGTFDYIQSSWQHDGERGQKCRQVSYTMSLSSGPIGPKQVAVTESQVINKVSRAGLLYSIDSTSENAGIPYADYFVVMVHYCIQRISDHTSAITLYGHVKYKKSVWPPMIKSFIEKNAYAGVEEFARLLESKLLQEVERGAPTVRKGRRRRRVPVSSQEAVSSITPITSGTPSTLTIPRRSSLSHSGLRSSRLSYVRDPTRLMLILLALLLIINGILYWKLYYTEYVPHVGMADIQQRMSELSAEQMADWSKLLEQHTHRQRDQLLAWREALDRAILTLEQTEKALLNILEAIKPSLERTQHTEL